MKRAWSSRLALALGFGSTLLGFALAGRTLTLPVLGAALEFGRPELLGLLGFGAWIFGRPSSGRERSAAALRIASWACLVLALCSPQLRRQSARADLVVIADVSASMTDGALAETREHLAGLARAQSAQPGQDVRVQLISVAREPHAVVPSPAAIRRHAPASGEDPILATDLQAGLKAAYARFDAARVPNVLLISDGAETHGDLEAEAERAARLGVRVDVLAPRAPALSDVAVRKLTLSDALAVGVQAKLRATLTAERPAHASVRLFAASDSDRVEAERDVDLAAGATEVEFPITVKAPGRIEYRLELTPRAPDRWTENNRASIAAQVPGEPRVLIVDSEPALAATLVRALRERRFDVEVRTPATAPATPADLADYAFVIMSDVPPREMRPGSIEALGLYVEELGGGLLVAGGGLSFAASHPAFDRLLPVRAAAEEQRDQASLALALIIDCSGSMAGAKLELARKAASLTASTLADAELIEVIGFSSQPERRVRLQPASNRASIAQSIERLAATGGTQLYPALDAAYRDLRGAEARLKHAILLTDGQTQEAGIEDLASSMRAEGITLSTVGLGSEVNRTLLESLAALGGGRAYFPLDANNVPQIFMSEASRHRRPTAVDRTTHFFVRERAGFLDGIPIDAAPALGGYVTTQAKPRPAQVILDSERGEPLLARWHVGLGHVVAFTSDLKPRWSTALWRWPSFGRLLAQLVREHMRGPSLHDVALEARVSHGQLQVMADVIGETDRFEDDLTGELHVTSKQGEVARLPFVQTGPGRYEVWRTWTERGAFTLAATFRRQGQLRATGHGAFTASDSAEFEAAQTNTRLLARVAARTGGQQLTTAAAALRSDARRARVAEVWWPALTWLALALFLFEQCVRRARRFGKSVPPGREGG